MKKYGIVIIPLLLLLPYSPLQSQTQWTGWLASFNTIKTGKHTSLGVDLQMRSNDKMKNVQTLLFRAGFNYHVSKKAILTAGYAYTHNRRVFSTVTTYAPEHRLWQQFLYTHKIKNISISHRFRTEERFIGKTKVVNQQANTDGYLYTSRFRYFLRNVIPLKKGALQKGAFAALQNEIFLNVTHLKNVNGETFDQNRFYIAAGYRLHPSLDLEIGYMNQYINGRGTQFTNNQVIQLASYLRL